MPGSPSAGIALRKDYQESWAEFKSITKKSVNIYLNNNILLFVDTILTGQHCNNILLFVDTILTGQH